MKLCLVHSSVTSGSGSGRYIFDLAESFADDSHDVTLCCHECDEALEQRPNITVIRLPRPSGRLGSWRLGHVAHHRWLRKRLPEALNGRKFDLLMGSDLLFLEPIARLYGPTLPFIYAPLSMIAPIEIASYGMHGAMNFLGVRLYAKLQRWALERCDRLVRFTESSVKALERYYDMELRQKALVTVYVSKEFESGDTTQTVSLAKPSPRELLWVGRLIPSKNVAFLLRAAALIQATDWVMNVCNDGPEKQKLEALAQSLGLGSRVRFLGHVQDVAEMYRSAAVLLTASVLEQYSLTVMEGYAFGVPCIGLRPDWKTVFNSNEDQIVDGVTGFVVADEAEMARRIDQLLADEPARQRMAAAALEKKRSGFSFKVFYGELSDSALSLVESHPVTA